MIEGLLLPVCRCCGCGYVLVYVCLFRRDAVSFEPSIFVGFSTSRKNSKVYTFVSYSLNGSQMGFQAIHMKWIALTRKASRLRVEYEKRKKKIENSLWKLHRELEKIVKIERGENGNSEK